MRLDQWLIENGIFPTRERARQEILAGKVREKKSGQILDKAGMKVPRGLEVSIVRPNPFVSRAGEKLEFFLQQHPFNFQDKRVLDVGASTGGFTDCVLQRGAKKVWAVDVGTHQLHEKIRAHPNVISKEQTDIRSLDFEAEEIYPDFILIDVSFISVLYFLPLLKAKLPQAYFFILYKPQFETGRELPKKKGIVSEKDRAEGLQSFLLNLKKLGFYVDFVEDSAVRGAKGNQESIVAGRFGAPEHIFRTYDIRGKADTDLSNELFERLGYILGKKLLSLDEAKVGIGRDGRESSDRLFESLKKGLLRHSSIQIRDLGHTATPTVYFANHEMQLDAAFQITASHNPKEDNGLKMMIGQNTLFGPEIKTLYSEIMALETLPDWSGDESRVESLEESLQKEYLQFLHQQFDFKRKFKLVVDCANGMAGLLARRAFEPYSSELQMMYEEVDCRFPNHPADPTIESNLKELKERVISTGADLGFSYDGDADRLGVVSSSGRVFWGDELLMLLSEKVLKERPGASIIGEVKCSEKLFKMIRDRGGNPVMYRTGHSLIKKHMKEIHAPIAGEMSGHLFFADRYFGFDDALYASLRVMEVISEFNLDLDEWIKQFPTSWITPEIRVSCEESEKKQLVDQVVQYFKKETNCELSLIDGVRVSFKDGSWALVRASNTEAVLVVRIEALSQERLESVKSQVSEALQREVKY